MPNFDSVLCIWLQPLQDDHVATACFGDRNVTSLRHGRTLQLTSHINTCGWSRAALHFMAERFWEKYRHCNGFKVTLTHYDGITESFHYEKRYRSAYDRWCEHPIQFAAQDGSFHGSVKIKLEPTSIRASSEQIQQWPVYEVVYEYERSSVSHEAVHNRFQRLRQNPVRSDHPYYKVNWVKFPPQLAAIPTSSTSRRLTPSSSRPARPEHRRDHTMEDAVPVGSSSTYSTMSSRGSATASVHPMDRVVPYSTPTNLDRPANRRERRAAAGISWPTDRSRLPSAGASPRRHVAESSQGTASCRVNHPSVSTANLPDAALSSSSTAPLTGQELALAVENRDRQIQELKRQREEEARLLARYQAQELELNALLGSGGRTSGSPRAAAFYPRGTDARGSLQTRQGVQNHYDGAQPGHVSVGASQEPAVISDLRPLSEAANVPNSAFSIVSAGKPLARAFTEEEDGPLAKRPKLELSRTEASLQTSPDTANNDHSPARSSMAFQQSSNVVATSSDGTERERTWAELWAEIGR